MFAGCCFPLPHSGEVVMSFFHQPWALVIRGSLFVSALEMQFWGFLPKDLWGALGFSEFIPHPCQEDFSEHFSLKKKKKR